MNESVLSSHDPGGKIKTKLPPNVRGDAVFSPCGKYRCWLTRDWGPVNSPRVLWILMNPSTADAEHNDPTITRCMRFTQSWGFTSLTIMNVMDYRATNPKKLLEPGVHPCSIGNIYSIGCAAGQSSLIVCAWGKLPPPLARYGQNVKLFVPGEKKCLGYNSDGSPKHPLYLRANSKLLPYPAKRAIA